MHLAGVLTKESTMFYSVLRVVKVILKPDWAKLHPRALWLKSVMPNLGEDSSPLEDQEFDGMCADVLRIAAEGGCPEARYGRGCNLYDSGKVTEVVSFYHKAAKEDYAPAQ